MIPLKKSTTTLALLSYVPAASNAWVITRQGQHLSPAALATTTRPTNWQHPGRRHTGIAGPLRAGPFFGPEEEFICPDEEECEIDWDKMPGFDENSSNSNEDQNDDISVLQVEDELDIDMQPRHFQQPKPQPTFGSQALESLEKGRVRLEMNWQIEECETDKDSCTDFCQECAGSGKQPCRFCRGTGIVTFGNEFRSCLICADAVVGQEDCSSCRGTGQIASWASTMEDHMKHQQQQQHADEEETPMNFI